MFGKLFGNMKEIKQKQEEMRKKLGEIKIDHQSTGQEVKVTVNAARELVDISIDTTKVDMADVEQLQDLLTITINDALAEAAKREAEEMQKMLKDMLPPGLGNMSGLLGG